MVNFIAGVAVGAAFAPFWIGVWRYAKVKFAAYQASKLDTK